MTARRPRILLAKLGLDGHDKGIKVLARVLREAGMEVIYLGLHQTAPGIAAAAAMEDADVVGVSYLSGAYLPLTQALMSALQAGSPPHPRVVVGGNIAERDRPALAALGVAAVLPGGTDYDDIARTLRSLAEGGR